MNTTIKRRELLTKEQRLNFMKFPEDEWSIGLYYTFSKEDIEIIKKHRKEENQLGFAVQLAVLRYPGWPYTNFTHIPEEALQYIAKQISAVPRALKYYAKRENTIWSHTKEIREYYGFTLFNDEIHVKAREYLINLALENDNSIILIDKCICFLRENKSILPAITTIESLVGEVKENAETIVIKTIISSLSSEQREKLDEVVFSSSDKLKNKTILGWLKDPIGRPCSENFLKVIEKLEYIRELSLESIQLDQLHTNKINQIYKLSQRYEPRSFREFHEDKRHTMLSIFLLNLSKDLTDKAFEIHDRVIQTVMSSGRKAQEEIQKQNGKKINEKVLQFTNIGDAIIYAKENHLDPIKLIEESIGWSTFVNSVKEAKELARPSDYDYLDLIERKYSSLRRYTPRLLECLQFKSLKKNEPILESIEILKDLNNKGKRKVPENAPVNFISKRWKTHVIEKDGTINRRYYEMAILTEIRDRVKAGDISIDGSKQYKDFDDYLIPKSKWDKSKEDNKLSVSLSFDEYIAERLKSLNNRLNWVSKNLKYLDSVSIENGKISVSRLEKDTPTEAKDLSVSLYKIVPKISLTDLLLDVAQLTGFHNEFIHASTNKKPDKEDTVLIMAALLGMGTNIGLSKMADATPGITYKQLSSVSQWRMYDDAMTRAQAVLVNYHHKLKLSKYWGEGNTSSSDGMRMQLGVSSLHADSNPHYGTGKGTTIYRFASDQFSSYYTKIIHTNSRDATHVLDGLLNNDTDLNIEEHYTDTAGYTDQVFALTHLLGFRFAPRIRDISDVKLFTMDKADKYTNLVNLLKGKVNEKVIRENYDEVLRLAHSIREGDVTSSLIISKLGSYARQNSLSTALREMGKIEKTIFILDYISSEELRRKIHRGLNKGEAMNGLARAIFFGKQGELRERTIQNQLQRASALNLIINAISIWNTLYLEKAVDYKKSIGEEINEDLIAHISPLGWEHINMLGEYSFNFDNTESTELTRPLNV
ncbi:Tn3 family transposase [Clostridium perfringens]|nr:Tn3 family transposase [Clostridium perfringens]MDT7918762.1 Tn3 family transposase [Clostridium perfringens]